MLEISLVNKESLISSGGIAARGRGGGPVAEGQQPFESSAVGMLGEEVFRVLLVDV
jgi:hypothetical protein